MKAIVCNICQQSNNFHTLQHLYELKAGQSNIYVQAPKSLKKKNRPVELDQVVGQEIEIEKEKKNQ